MVENTPNPSEPSRLEASDAQKSLLNNGMQQVNWQSGSHVNAFVITCVDLLWVSSGSPPVPVFDCLQ